MVLCLNGVFRRSTRRCSSLKARRVRKIPDEADHAYASDMRPRRWSDPFGATKPSAPGRISMLAMLRVVRPYGAENLSGTFLIVRVNGCEVSAVRSYDRVLSLVHGPERLALWQIVRHLIQSGFGFQFALSIASAQ